MNPRTGIFLRKQPFLLRVFIVALLFGYFATPRTTLLALPSGASVTHGSASFQSGDNSLTVHQTTDKLITNWQSFSISQGNAVRFNQPSSTSEALNRVVGGTRSLLDGTLEANGKIILINPAGITVGPTGIINVNSFTASTLDIADEEFLGTGDYLFQGGSTSSVENHGLIRAAGGDAFLIARQVLNKGTIEALSGTAGTAAGSEVLVKPAGEQRIYIKPGSQSGNLTQTATGRISAVKAEVVASGNPYATAINLDGLISVKGTDSKPKATTRVATTGGGKVQVARAARIEARSQDESGGRIELRGGEVEVAEGARLVAEGAGQGGTIHVEAENQLTFGGIASAVGGAGIGGTINLLGEFVAVGSTAYVDAASLESMGGQVHVGGGFQGTNPDLRNATGTSVAAGAILRADGGRGLDLASFEFPDADTGDEASLLPAGGTVVVWADNWTWYEGFISATGANGGFAEVSGKAYLRYSGGVDLTAANGELGTLLLDPANIDIVAGDVAAIVSPFDPAANSTIGWNNINAAGANVIISTYAGAGGDGDINLIDNGTWLGAGTLRLEAYRDINFGAGIVVSATNLTGSFDFQAGRDFNMQSGTLQTADDTAGTGTISIVTGVNSGAFPIGNLNHAGGNIYTRGNGNVLLRSETGNVNLGNATQASSRVVAGFRASGAAQMQIETPGGEIRILQTQTAGPTGNGDAADWLANLAAVTDDVFWVGSMRGDVVLRTGAGGAGAFTTNRNIEITLLNGAVMKRGGQGSLTLDSQGDVVLLGGPSPFKLMGYVGTSGTTASSGDRGDITVQVSGDMTMTQGIGLQTTPVFATEANSSGYGVVNIDIAGDLNLLGGTTTGWLLSDTNGVPTGARIDGGISSSRSVLFLTVGGDVTIGGAAGIGRFNYEELVIAGNLDMSSAAAISNVGSSNPSHLRNGLLQSLPGYGSAVGGSYLSIGGDFTGITGMRMDSIHSGHMEIVVAGNIDLRGGSDPAQGSPRFNIYNSDLTTSGHFLMQSTGGTIRLNQTSVTARTSALNLNHGNITVQALGNVTLEGSNFITNTRSTGSGEDAQILVESLNGSILLPADWTLGVDTYLSGSTRFTMSNYNSDSSDPADYRGLITLRADNGDIVQNAELFTDATNLLLTAQNLFLNGRLQITADDKLQLTATTGDIQIHTSAYNSFANSRIASLSQGINSALNLSAARDIILQPASGAGALAIGHTPGNTTVGLAALANPNLVSVNILAARDVVIGGTSAVSGYVAIGGSVAPNGGMASTAVGTAGDIQIRADGGIVTLNRVDTGGNNSVFTRIETIKNYDISIFGRDGIHFDVITGNFVNGKDARVISVGGTITLETQDGDIQLGRLISTSGDMNLTAGNGSILDAFGVRIMSAASHANITTTSGEVNLDADVSVGVGQTPNPIGTISEIKFNHGSNSNVNAVARGTGATDGVFLNAYNDLILGLIGNTSVTSEGDVVLKSRGNVFVNGNIVSTGAGRTIGIRSNDQNVRNTAFVTDASAAGDVVIAGSIGTDNGDIVIETGSVANPASSNDIRYNPLVTEAISSGNGDVTLRANRDVALGRIVTNSGDVSVTAGRYIYDVFPLEVRDNTAADGGANIVVTGPGAAVTLFGGRSVGLLPNGQDIDLALLSGTQLTVNGLGTNAAAGDGVFLSFLGDFSTATATATVLSGSNLGISVTGNLTVATGGSLTTQNNGSIWLTAYGTSGPGTGHLIINAPTTAYQTTVGAGVLGEGNINIFGVGRVEINSSVQTGSGNISIVGAGRGEVYGVEINSGSTVTTGGTGEIHLAALGSVDASGLTVTTDAGYGRVRVGDVVIAGETTSTVAADGIYYVGVTYGAEVVYGTGPTGGEIIGEVGSSATTNQQSILTNAQGNGITYTVDSVGQVLIQTQGVNSLTTTGNVGVTSVTIAGANTSVTGDAGAQATTVTGLGVQLNTLVGGTTEFAANYPFVLAATGGVTVSNTNNSLALTNTGGTFTVGDVSTNGGSATLLSAAGATSSINAASQGGISVANYTGTATTTIGNGDTNLTLTAGALSASGSNLLVTVDSNTTIAASTNVALNLNNPGASLDLGVAATSANTTLSSLGGGTLQFDNTATTVLDTSGGSPVLTFGNGASSLTIYGGATSDLGSVLVGSTQGNATVNLAVPLTAATLDTIAANGATVGDLARITINSGQGVVSYAPESGGPNGNFTLDAGLGLEFAANTFSTTGAGNVTANSPTFTAASVTYSNTLLGATAGNTVAHAGTLAVSGGQGLSGTQAAEIVLVISGTGPSSYLEVGAQTITSSTNMSTVVTQPGWSEIGTTGVFEFTGNFDVGGTTLVSNGSLQAQMNNTAPATVTGQTLTFDSSNGRFTTTGINLAAGTFHETVNVRSNTTISEAVYSITGGVNRVANATTGPVGYTNVALTGANFTTANATGVFQNAAVTGSGAVTSSHTVTTQALLSANVAAGTTTFGNSITTGAGNALTMAAVSSQMTVTPGGALVNVNGINSIPPGSGANASNLLVDVGSTVQTQGGNIYASGYGDAQLAQLDARGASPGNGGDLFVEASTGSVTSLTTSAINLIGNQATINGGYGIYGVPPTTGGSGGAATAAIHLDVHALNFSSGSGGAYFRMDQNRSLPVAGQSNGEVAILNDQAIRVGETLKMAFDPATGIDFTTRTWSPTFANTTLVGIDAGSQTVFLRATGANGHIVSDNNGRTTGGEIYLDAAQAIGESTTDRFLSNGSNIWFLAGNGSALISELDATSIAGTALATNAEIDIVTESLGDLTVATEGPGTHPISGTAYSAINGLRAENNVTVATHSGRILVNQDIVSDSGNIDLTANFNQTAGDFGILLNADVFALGNRVRALANNGDIWRTAGVIRAGDVQLRTNTEGAIGFTDGTERAVFIESPLISFNSVEAASLLNATQLSTVIGGLANGLIHVVNEDGDLTVQQHTNFDGTNLATAANETRAGVISTGDDVVIINQAGNVQLNDVTTAAAGASDVSIWSQAGSIFSNGAATSQVLGAVITLVSGPLATHVIGTLSNRIFTNADDLVVDSGSDVFINELDGTRLAGITANNGNADALSGGTIRVDNLDANFNIGALVYNPAAFYGIHANGSGYITLDANGATSDVEFAATARSGTGTVTILADRNLTDEIATDITDGLNSNSLLLNIATGGNIVLNAGNNIGGKGIETIDVAAGGTITATSGGTAVADGTYLSVLGHADILGITSGRNIDVSTFQRAAVGGGLSAQEGDLTVSAPMINPNPGYTRLNARRHLILNAIINSGAGDIILQARTGDVTQTNDSLKLTGDSLLIEALNGGAFGTTGAGVLATDVNRLSFRVQDDLRLTEDDGLTVSGIATQGNVVIASTTGDIRIDDLGSYQAWALGSADDDIDNPANGLNFAHTGSNSGIRANTTSGVITLNALGGSILDVSTAEDNNLTAFRAVLNAANHIGTGPMFDAGDLNTELVAMSTVTPGGSVNVRELDALTLHLVNVTNGNFHLNTAGLIDQQIDGLTAFNVSALTELDTTRAPLGHATVLANDGDGFEVGDSEVAGDFQLGSDGLIQIDGDVLVAGELNVGLAGMELLSGASVIGGDLTIGGGYTHTGGNILVYGGSNEPGLGIDLANNPLSIAGTLATITATGTNPDFNLSTALDLADSILGSVVEDVVVNLRGSTVSLDQAVVNAVAILLTDAANNSINRLLVRTGPVDTVDTVAVIRDYNLVQSAGIGIGGRSLTVHAATGTNFTPTVSPFAGSTLNGGNGSTVTLQHGANQFGLVRVHDAYDTILREAGNLDLAGSRINGLLDAESIGGNLNFGAGGEAVHILGTSRLVALGTGANVSFEGDAFLGDHAIAAAGVDMAIAPGVALEGYGAMTFVVDENAGPGIGDGWFINEGTITTHHGDVAIYAVGGPLHAPGFLAPPNQITWGTIQDGVGTDLVADMQAWNASAYGGSSLNHKYATSYQGGGTYHPAAWADYEPGQGLFGSPVIWYKSILSPIIIPPVTFVGSASIPFLAPLKQFATLFFDQLAIPPNLKEERYRSKGFSIYQAVDAETGTSLAFSTRGEDPVFNYDLVLDGTYFIEKVSYLGEQGSRRRTSEHVE